MSLSALIDALRLVSEGHDFSDDEFEKLMFSSDDRIVRKVADDAWNLLRRFVNDADIRAKDEEYDRSQREAAAGYLGEIEALQRGEDPRGRRLSWLSR